MGSRLRLYNAGRYASADAIAEELRNITTYINAAELGNLTLAELLSKLFSEDGELRLGVELRFSASDGLQVRYSPTDDWETVAAADSLRGPAGVNTGLIDGPVFFNRKDIVATAGQQAFDYTLTEAAADIQVFCNGLLQPTNSYAISRATNKVTLATPQTGGAVVTIRSIRNNAVNTYRRIDFTAAAGQSTFPFPHADTEILDVYRNGILQRGGATADYVSSSESSSVTMTMPQTAGTVISVLVVQNSALRSVLGLMMEERYATDGMIRFDRLSIPDGGIDQGKVNGLTAALAQRADVYVSASAPSGVIRAGSLWVRTSTAVPTLLFYDGSRWLPPSPTGNLPVPTASDALRLLRLNATATAFEFADLDLSGVVATSRIGAASGVAALDITGVVPQSQIAAAHRRINVTAKVAGAITNGTQSVGVLGGMRGLFDMAHFTLDAGSCTVQMRVGTTDLGLPVAVAAGSVARQVWSAVALDLLAAGQAINLVITSASSASGLCWSLQGTLTS